MIRGGARKGNLALLLWLCAAAAHARPLALILTPEPDKPLAAELRAAGYDVQSPALPCAGSLPCWAANIDHAPFAEWEAQMARTMAGREVTLVGVSRGGYLALRLAQRPEVRQVIAFSPVTDLSRLREFRGVTVPGQYALDPKPLVGKRLFVVIGSNDGRVGTNACLRLVARIVVAAGQRTPDLTLEVLPVAGHRRVGDARAAAWVTASAASPSARAP
jgi:pimeloyl-ACP methyl ester carboxylesterase